MADKARTILSAINVILTAETVSGESLEDIGSFFVKYTESDLPSEYGSVPPVLVVDMLPMLGENASIPACMTRKTYPVKFDIYTENAGDTTNTQAAVLLDALEDIFYQNQLSIPTLLVDIVGRNYTIPGVPPFQSPVNGGASMTINYRYTDTRAIP